MASALFLGAAILGAAISPAVRGSGVGLGRWIETVDLGAAVLGQASAFLTSLLLVHFSLTLLRERRPFVLVLLAVLPAALPAALLVLAQRSALPREISWFGALASLWVAGAVAFLARGSQPRVLGLLAVALSIGSRALEGGTALPTSAAWTSLASASATAAALFFALSAARALLRETRFGSFSCALALGLGLLAVPATNVAVSRGAPLVVSFIGRSLFEWMSAPDPHPLRIFALVFSCLAAFIGFTRGETGRRVSFWGALGVAAAMPLGPLSLAFLTCGALALGSLSTRQP